jgi:hypothetical protein
MLLKRKLRGTKAEDKQLFPKVREIEINSQCSETYTDVVCDCSHLVPLSDIFQQRLDGPILSYALCGASVLSQDNRTCESVRMRVTEVF